MACLNCATRVLRVFLPESIPSLRATRAFPAAATGRRPALLQSLPQRRTLHHLRRTSTVTALRPLNDDDYIPFVPASDEFLPSAVRERLVGPVNPVGPPPPPPPEASLEEWDVAALVGLPKVKVVERVVRKVEITAEAEVEAEAKTEAIAEAETAEDIGQDQTPVEKLSTQPTMEIPATAESELATSPEPTGLLAETAQITEKEMRAIARREKYYAALKARKEAQKAFEKAEKEEDESEASPEAMKFTTSERTKKQPAVKAQKIALENAASLVKHRTKDAEKSPKHSTTSSSSSSPLSRGSWDLPEIEEVVPEKLARLEAHIAKTKRKELEPWMIQKAAVMRKLGGEQWDPKKKLSPEALDGIRALHAQDPERFSTPKLARLFEVTPEAIRRILKSKWKPKPEEAVERDLRWKNRGHTIFQAKVEQGEIIPKSKKNREKKERYEKEKMRRTLERPLPGNIGDRIL